MECLGSNLSRGRDTTSAVSRRTSAAFPLEGLGLHFALEQSGRLEKGPCPASMVKSVGKQP